MAEPRGQAASDRVGSSDAPVSGATSPVEQATPRTFKESFPDFQHLAREISVLREINLRAMRASPQVSIHLYGQLTVTFVALERFLRMVVRIPGTLPNLLERLGKKKQPMVILGNREKDIRLVNGMRVALLHGLFMPDRVPREANARLLPFAFDLYQFVNEIVDCFDRDTGKPASPARSVSFPKYVENLPKIVSVLTPDNDLAALRNHNLLFGPDDTQHDLLLQTEGALSMVMVEAMARKALKLPPGDDGPEKFREVVELAVFGDPKRLTIFLEDELRAVERMCRVRNTILHGNYEQAALEAGCTDVPHYFKTAFAREVEWMFQIYQSFNRQAALA